MMVLRLLFFFVTDFQLKDIYGIKTDKQFLNTFGTTLLTAVLQTNGLVTVQVKISYKIVDILRSICIKSWQSESYQHQ
jgi:hypothetical protein